MPLSREQEYWSVALWIEKEHGDRAWFFIAQQKDRLLSNGDISGMRFWDEIERRLELLNSAKTLPC